MSIWTALALVTLCAILWDVGIVLQKLAVDELPRIRFDRSLPATVASLLRSRRWLAGLAASALGWGLFAFALVFIPVSVARAIQGSGFVVLAVFSLVFLRHRLSAGEWIGVALAAAGIAALGISETPAESLPAELSAARLLPALAACILVCFLAYFLPGALKVRLPWAVSFSVMAGILLGLGDVATKILIEILQRGESGFEAAGAGAGLIASYVAGFLVLSRSYQHGRAILVTAVSDLCSRLVAICVGIGALGETLARDPLLRALAVAGYAGIMAGAALLARFSGEEMAAGLARTRAAARSGVSQVLGQSEEAEAATPPEIDTDP
jgi:drug/metabolite transporter (DMT)-like permease